MVDNSTGRFSRSNCQTYPSDLDPVRLAVEQPHYPAKMVVMGIALNVVPILAQGPLLVPDHLLVPQWRVERIAAAGKEIRMVVATRTVAGHMRVVGGDAMSIVLQEVRGVVLAPVPH